MRRKYPINRLDPKTVSKIPEVWHGKPSKTAKSAKPENFRKGKGKRRKTARGLVSEWRGHWLQPARLRVGRPHVRREEGPQKRNVVRVTSSDRTSDRICNARRQVGRACRPCQALEAQETVREEGTPNGLKPLRTVLLHSTTVVLVCFPGFWPKHTSTTPSREAYSVCPYQPVRRPVRCKSYDFVRFTPSTE